MVGAAAFVITLLNIFLNSKDINTELHDIIYKFNKMTEKVNQREDRHRTVWIVW